MLPRSGATEEYLYYSIKKILIVKRERAEAGGTLFGKDEIVENKVRNVVKSERQERAKAERTLFGKDEIIENKVRNAVKSERQERAKAERTLFGKDEIVENKVRNAVKRERSLKFLPAQIN